MGPLLLDGVSRVASPYDLNPAGGNPLAEVLAKLSTSTPCA